jgi:hypothetical protein
VTDHGQRHATGSRSGGSVPHEPAGRGPADEGWSDASGQPLVAVLDSRTGSGLAALDGLAVAVTLAELRRRLVPSSVEAFALTEQPSETGLEGEAACPLLPWDSARLERLALHGRYGRRQRRPHAP